MKKICPALVVLGLLCSHGSTAAAEPQFARVIVKYRDDNAATRLASGGPSSAALTGARSMGFRHGLALTDGRTIAPRTQVFKASGVSSAELVAKLVLDPELESVEIDRPMRRQTAPNDPLYSGNLTTSPAVGQWYLRQPTADIHSSIDAEGAWAISTGRSNIVVAVLDTGIRGEHPDLAGKLLPGYDFVTDDGIANDAQPGQDNDPSDPGDWVSIGDIGSVVNIKCVEESSSWHGTQTAGLIGAATGNGIGMAGAGHDIRLLPVRVLGKCGGFISDIVAGIRWAGGLSVPGVPANTNPARVINLSLGGTGACSSTYQETINAVLLAGVVVVASAGNEGLAVGQPANCRGVVAVGGVRHAGSKNGFANLGPEVLISAPGGNCVNPEPEECLYPILSTSNAGLTTPGASIYTDGFATSAYGTSFSAPLVAGTVALMLSVAPTLTPAQISLMLQRSARAFPDASTDSSIPVCQTPSARPQGECHCRKTSPTTCGAGMLDSRAAVFAATQPPPSTESTGGGAMDVLALLCLAGIVVVLARLNRPDLGQG